ncbi:hypothetical protein FACS189413_11400 [Bacteroidia bacterium]|nr:hypothetical protein FACS189463_1590 [Bacteroidia bacterium]GHU70701.1 hypothetical protein FACS189413_11400 [Bacteroidia bacterium]
MKKVFLILLLNVGAFSATYALNGTERSTRFERATPPSETTAAGMTGKSNDVTTSGSLRGAGETLPEPGPVGSGLGILTLCAGAYLFNAKKNGK